MRAEGVSGLLRNEEKKMDCAECQRAYDKMTAQIIGEKLQTIGFLVAENRALRMQIRKSIAEQRNEKREDGGDECENLQEIEDRLLSLL